MVNWAEALVLFAEGCVPRCASWLLARLLLAPRGEYRCLRAAAGFLWGFLLGFLLLRLLLRDLVIGGHVGVILGATIVLLLAAGNAVSTQVRCITLLALPALCSRGGRTTLRVLVIAFLVAGPVANLTDNAIQVGKVFACGARLAANLTRTRWDLLYRPLQKALTRLRTNRAELRSISTEVREVAAPLKQEVQGRDDETEKLREENDYFDAQVGDTKRSEDIEKKYTASPTESAAARYDRQYRRRLEYRCQGLLTKAADRCRRTFQKAYDNCYDKVTFLAAWLLCWPMKLTFICSMVSSIGGASSCDPSTVVQPEFGADYASMQNASGALESGMNVRLQYEVVTIAPMVDVHGADDVALAMAHDVARSKAILDTFMSPVRQVLSFMVVGILLEAQRYHDRYRADLNFDNRYVTEHFRRIDARRRQRGAKHLLPLRRAERLQLVEAVGVWPGAKERGSLALQSLALLLEILVPLAVFLLDELLYGLLSMIRRHGRIDYQQIGQHSLSVRVKGSGMIAQLVRKIISEFNVHQAVNVRHSNQPCLPRPKRLHWWLWVRVLLVYLALWLLLVFRAGLGRLHRAVCAYFYPERERRRVLRLYNDTLKRRWGMARFMRARVRVLAKQGRLERRHGLANILGDVLAYWWPSAHRTFLPTSSPNPADSTAVVSKALKTAQGRSRPSKALKAAQGRSRPLKAAQGRSRPLKAAQGRSRPLKAAQGRPRPFKAAQGSSRSLAAPGLYRDQVGHYVPEANMARL
ncbi:protein sneaky [Thrips palmi]|uniref:Protein sneaky n=1 Tax=Thrips palmi TaxID=161013 RepID=A0A6P9A856_THRPL|nr:protein sneaky [Thrips palmi]